MARLAGSLVNLFAEIDARWPNRGKGSDGWIGDRAHQARRSDHNPDSRGIVHAIDITRSPWTADIIIAACIRDDRPTSYVIHNRLIWTRSRNWEARRYTGSNPHTGHIHVSIQHGTRWEADTWAWGIADLGKRQGGAVKPGASDDLSDWSNSFRAAGDLFVTSGNMVQTSADMLVHLMR